MVTTQYQILRNCVKQLTTGIKTLKQNQKTIVQAQVSLQNVLTLCCCTLGYIIFKWFHMLRGYLALSIYGGILHVFTLWLNQNMSS